MKNIKTVASALALSFVMLFTACSGSEDVEFKRGKYDESTKKYTSETFGITATLDDTWTVYSDSELAQVGGMTGSTDEDFIKQLDSKGGIFDFYALSTDTTSGTNINITVENLKVTNGNSGISEKVYIEAVIPKIKQQYESMGATVEKTETGTTTFCGKKVDCVFSKVTLNGVTFYQTQVPIKKGKYMAGVTFTSISEDTVNELVKKFSSI